MPRPASPTDLSEAEWAILEPLIPAPRSGGRPLRHARRAIVTAMLAVLRTGCQWRAVPHDRPPWGTVWWDFRPWRDAGVGERVETALRAQNRLRLGRQPTPRAAILDRQTVKTTEQGAARR